MKWCVPVKDSMKLAVSARPCMDIAANCRPAIQPSVRVSSAAMSVRREVQAHRPVEKLGGFAGGETQVRGTQFGQLAARAEPGQGQRRILTGGDDQVHLRRQVFQQKGEGLVHRFGINHVVVVKDEDEAFREGGELVDQGRQQRFGWRRLRGLERSQHTRSRNHFDCRNGLQSRDEVGQKACEVVIPFLQRQPGNFGKMKDKG